MRDRAAPMSRCPIPTAYMGRPIQLRETSGEKIGQMHGDGGQHPINPNQLMIDRECMAGICISRRSL